MRNEMYKFENRNADSLSRIDIDELLRQYGLIKFELEMVNRQLEEKQKILDSFLDKSPFFIYFIKDSNFRIIMASHNFGPLIFGKKTEELLNKTNHEIFDNDFADRADNDDRMVLEGKIAIIEEKFRGQDFFAYKFPMEVDGKKMIGGYISTNTQNKKIQELITNQVGLFSGIISDLYNVVVLTDLDGKILKASRGCVNVFEYSEEELKNRHIYDLIINKDDCIVFNKKLMDELYDDGTIVVERNNFLSKKGKKFFSKCGISMLKDNNEEYSYILFNLNRIYK